MDGRKIIKQEKMKTGNIVLIILIALILIIGAFFLGRSLPNGDLQAEVKILGEVIKEQNTVIYKMDSTLLVYKEKMLEFVINFDTFKVEQEVQLKKLSSSVRGGRAFEEEMLIKLTSLGQRRDSLAAEAAKFQY